MGMYTNNTFVNLADIEFPTLEGYVGSVGASIALVEGYQNDFALFQAGIYGDFQEMAAIKEGAEDVFALQEFSIKGIFDKVIEFFKKLGAKIKAIFTTFAAKLGQYFNKDNKDFVKKYRKVIFAAGRNYSKMKVKYSKPKDASTYICPINYGTIYIPAPPSNYTEWDRDIAVGEILTKCLGDLKANDIADIKTQMHDKMFESEEVKDDWVLGDLSNIATRLEGGNKAISDIERKNKNLQDGIKKVIAEVQKMQNAFTRAVTAKGDDFGKYRDSESSKGVNASYGDDYKTTIGKSRPVIGFTKDTMENEQKRLNFMQNFASVHQSCILAFCNAVMAEAKFGIAQDRRVWAQAASFRNVSKESADMDLLDAIGEVADFETESDFDQMEFIA